MNNYNICLRKLRKEKGLTYQGISKATGISTTKLFLYEYGYFRPSKKHIEKLNELYGENISIDGDNAYPGPIEENKKNKDKYLKGKRIAFGILSAFSLILISVGATLFSLSVNNTNSFYGETYNELHDKVVAEGDYGYDIVTSLKYYRHNVKISSTETNIIFYQSNNILYFNEVVFSKTFLTEEYGIDRYHYQFGSNLGVNSFQCNFNYSCVSTGSAFSCSFIFENKAIDHVDNFKTLVKGQVVMDEQAAVKLINSQVEEINTVLSQQISGFLGKTVDFYSDFLPAREKGRAINFALQITGLVLIFPGIILFYIFFGIFVNLLLKNVKPKMVGSEPDSIKDNVKPLPNDINIKFGIPDIYVVLLGKMMQYASIVLLLIAFLGNLGVTFFSFFSNSIFLNIFRWTWAAGIFLESFVMIGRFKKPSTLFRAIIYNLAVFLFIATIETVIIALTNAWGYDLADMIYSYVPGNVYQVVAIQYLIFFFLYYKPNFINKGKRGLRFLWHSLSLLPLGLLVASYFISNQYAFVYGVDKNIYISFWFPNAFLALSVVSVLFIYIVFFLKLYFEKKYGRRNSHYFFNGDRFTLYVNGICALLMIIAASVDFIFLHNQYGYYLGLGTNYGLYVLVPFVLLCKYSPNSSPIFLVDEGFKRMVNVEE